MLKVLNDNMIATAITVRCRAMEPRDHAKNGVSPKDHTSRGNNLNLCNMKRTCFKVQLAVILVCGLFAVATISSCDKAKKLNGTTWSGDYEDDTHKGDIELSFSGDAVDISISLTQKTSTGGGGGNPYQPSSMPEKSMHKAATNYKAEASFTCEKTDISFGTIKWKSTTSNLESKDSESGKWKGTVDKDVITLKNVLAGQTVKFKKGK